PYSLRTEVQPKMTQLSDQLTTSTEEPAGKMECDAIEIRIEGKALRVPCVSISGRTIIATGKWLKVAAVQDEDLWEGEAVDAPVVFFDALKKSKLKADVFTFAQQPAATKPNYGYFMEWDNAAAIPIKGYANWLESLPQETRRNIKKAAKSGVILKSVPFDDSLVKGIVDIYDETPVRQGRAFWHYQKGFQKIKEEKATYLQRSEFIGAYLNEELIGFIKLVYVGEYASILHILSKVKHADKRPTNALIAKAVEICAERGKSYLLYCKYVYGKNDTSPLTEFKRRNGFEKLQYPRYYIPLTSYGNLVLKLRLHHGFVNMLPKSLVAAARIVRKKCFEAVGKKNSSGAKTD
ncbi:MAG TPA: hypothetical protein VK633_10085, partial [Verrucomicrobiae bacterium]|nr:hypothetical protein [Verrucomicrobiae bacterium]